ncbi:23S rRNA (adenine(1618)-N(6))-methyltransferase RlmF [Shewanella xiamenensis]|uniref:23S rRNA (adenine(1618)-N(6))-methyltransferase RlmF n=1 Tax=Shewanella xiamenensis TaxID=332186 RepID=UPI0016648156|nr:23S rRNA (adenine(1618)-N(6))-methyltransferase RlmF [Shewanella xiamenensis]MBW0296017.1 23S rRNA (adenine(1618)-N(6))-methyltransferase [Shewanella xiamenensis]MCL1071631.1 23S rRNA (adenine(1618)-N(6))-methyltransferase RlmF [Shewanella xiamenensis]MCR4533973.1 23S rRNA (adenine(1618)-N(6))-methyltransferase RlmF [Shewanella xiamenensis]MDH1314000.1 23S rRNA (adenine(1618)-N(6))-methyltransferase RlmF [Shewanella xiamenensis]WHF55841.1 23S rRNA (adenine(1618)-N(6))-methyltransferase RlmF
MSKPVVKIAAKPAMSPTGKRSKPSTPKPLVAKPAKPAKPNIAPAKATSKPKQGVERKTLHPRNLHAHGYDFSALMTSYPKLKTFVRPTPYGALSIDFADPIAVKTLNAALLKHHYGLAFWDIPKGALCPPIPGRVDYLHYLADLLFEGAPVQRAGQVSALDIGTGANGVYAILGHQVYGWQFVASDINPQSLTNVQRIIDNNPSLQGHLSLRQQQDEKVVFKGIIQASDRFELTLCNPPFHGSLKEASEGSLRKVRNLQLNRGEQPKAASATLNFGGQAAELWCQGGERQFLATMIRESQAFAEQCLWFTSLVSKQENLKPCYQALAKLGVDTVKTIEMQQGNKITRVLAWSFHSQAKRLQWRNQIVSGT